MKRNEESPTSWVDVLGIFAAASGVLGLIVWLNMTAIALWWHQNWWWIALIAALVTSRWWLAPARELISLPWAAFVGTAGWIQDWQDRNESRLLLAAVRKQLAKGADTEYSNAVSGVAFKVSLPVIVEEVSDDEKEEQNLLPAPRFPEPRDFANVLELWRPSAQEIFLLDTVEQPVTSPMNKVCHVALGGPTGGGKTTCARLLVSQLLSCGAEMYMCNPNFAPVKLNGNRLEDWRPIVAKLKEPPVREIDDILNMFERFIDLVDERREQEQLSPKRGNDVFLYIGEWPAIFSQAIAKGNKVAKRLVAQMGRLLRETRQYGVHVISEFQDALVSTIGGNSGVRENYGTCYYFGGDLNTAKVLLNLGKGESVDDSGLGKLGAVYMRGHGTPATSGRIPFFSNRALYMLLGFPQDPVHDNLVNDPSNVGSFFPDMGSSRIVESARTNDLWNDRENTDSGDEILCAYNFANEDTLEQPVEPTYTDAQYQIAGTKVELFCLAYKLTGSIDNSLKEIGLHTRYRDSARQLIAERSLKGGK